MHAFFNAVETFFDHLTAIDWRALGIAYLFHVTKVVLRTRAWRNILAAAYPEARVPWRSVFGAYVAGVGVNAIAPARGGDLVKLYLIRRRIPGSTYPTLGSTLVVETLFDFVVASALLVWAIQLGVLPGLDILPSLPSIEWGWPLRHPRIALFIAGALFVAGVLLAAWASRRIVAFKRRVAQGFAILGDPPRYLRQVITWQALSWGCRLASTYWFLRAFGIDANLRNALLAQVSESLSTVLPLTPGGAGTEQGLLVFLLSGEASTTALLSFSVGKHIAIVAINVAIGFSAILVMLGTLRWRRVVAPEEVADRGLVREAPRK